MLFGFPLSIPAALLVAARDARDRCESAPVSGPLAGALGFAAVVALIALRVPVAIAMGIVGTLGYGLVDGRHSSPGARAPPPPARAPGSCSHALIDQRRQRRRIGRRLGQP